MLLRVQGLLILKPITKALIIAVFRKNMFSRKRLKGRKKNKI